MSVRALSLSETHLAWIRATWLLLRFNGNGVADQRSVGSLSGGLRKRRAGRQQSSGMLERAREMRIT